MTANRILVDNAVRATFRTGDLETIRRVVMAAIDQLCAVHDVELRLLECLDVPVGAALAAIRRFEIDAVEIAVTDFELALRIVCHADPVSTSGELFDADAELVEAFFTTDIDTPRRRIELVGSLR